MGVVNLFGDMAYEGGASINGPFLQSLGASAATVSIIAGVGEFPGYSRRSVSGCIAATARYCDPLSLAPLDANDLARDLVLRERHPRSIPLEPHAIADGERRGFAHESRGAHCRGVARPGTESRAGCAASRALARAVSSAASRSIAVPEWVGLRGTCSGSADRREAIALLRPLVRRSRSTRAW